MRTSVDLNKFNQGKSPQQTLKEKSRGLVNKWEKTGLLEGLDREEETHGLAILLENQYQQLVNEANRTGTSEGSEEWAGVALPLVRRVFGEIVAKEFVSVQPMNLPSGLIFFLDFKYGSTQPGFNEDDLIHGDTEVEGDPTGGFYGEGRFTYSMNDQTVEGLDSTGGAGTERVVSVDTVSKSRVDFDPDLVGVNGTDLTVDGDDLLRAVTVDLPETADPDGVRGFTIASSIVDQFYPAHIEHIGTFDGKERVEFVVLPTTSGAVETAADFDGDNVTVEYQVQPETFDRGDFEDRSPNPDVAGPGDNGDYPSTTNPSSGYEILDIPEIDFDLRSEPIAAKTRKLKAVWTPELAQDLNAYHSIDAEAELTSMLSEYISMEIDLEILDMLISNALTREYWSTKVGFEYDPATDSFVDAGSQPGARKNDWFQTLGNKIQSVSNSIHQKTMRGGANFLVCSPQVATILESIEGFRTDTGGDEMQFAMGVQRVGTLYNRFQVYKNPYMLENIILVGYRGQSFLETGAVYAPYIPLIMTPIVYDPNNFTPRRGVMTRYAKRMVRPEFYGIVVVDNPGRV